MAVIEKRERKKGTVYRVKIRMRGMPMRERSFDRLTDAKAWAAETESAMRNGDLRTLSSEVKRRTVADVIQRYRDEILPHKATTSQRAEQTYLKFWHNELGQYALSFLTPEIISKKITLLTHAGDERLQLDKDAKPAKPKSRKTIKLYRDNLEVTLNHAQRWGWLGKNNPMDGVNRITKANNERVRFLSNEERTALLQACKDSPNKQLHTIVIFALSTGARKSEILKLTLNDLDMDRCMAILRETKNHETRKAPIGSHLKNILLDHLQWRDDFISRMQCNSNLLFPRSDGKTGIDIRKAWENARGKANIVDFRFHDLRHSAASYLAMNGASQLEIAEVLGHKTLQMVKRYSHLSIDHTHDVIERMNSKIFDLKD